MRKNRIDDPLKLALIGCALLGITLTARADPAEGDSARATPSRVQNRSCEATQLAAWFDYQRQLTDGSAVAGQWMAARCGSDMKADSAHGDVRAGSGNGQPRAAKSAHG